MVIWCAATSEGLLTERLCLVAGDGWAGPSIPDDRQGEEVTVSIEFSP